MQQKKIVKSNYLAQFRVYPFVFLFFFICEWRHYLLVEFY